MKASSAPPAPAETELKLALPGADPRDLAARLARLAPLAGLAPRVQVLRNLYVDTPDQLLRGARAALRLRSLREPAPGQACTRTQWLQTFKTAGSGQGGLSQRGEWEQPVRQGRLDLLALQATPWHGLDQEGRRFGELAPVFETHATRTLWEVRSARGSRIEVALDVGEVRAGERRQPLCELELELLAGPADALFVLAGRIARSLAVLPAHLSKAERGWRLADGAAHAPRRAQTLPLTRDTALPLAAQQVLGEALDQFTANLEGILGSDGPELVHQARVGWRRWRSALWLFKPLLAEAAAPDAQALRPLLKTLGAMRDLDVAALETLPLWADTYIEGDPDRAAAWRTMEAAVQAARQTRRAALLIAMQQPACGQALLAAARWLHALPAAPLPGDLAGARIGPWAADRTKRLHTRLAREADALDDADLEGPEVHEHQHRLRLLAKRTRYCLDAVRPALPKSRTKRWHDEAADLQTSIGAARDLMLLADLLQPLGVDRGILGFLRGVAAGRAAAL